MLTFSPDKRITVEQALAHPYLSMLHDPSHEPASTHTFGADFNLQFDDPPTGLDGEEVEGGGGQGVMNTASSMDPLKEAFWDEINAFD